MVFLSQNHHVLSSISPVPFRQVQAIPLGCVNRLHFTAKLIRGAGAPRTSWAVSASRLEDTQDRRGAGSARPRVILPHNDLHWHNAYHYVARSYDYFEQSRVKQQGGEGMKNA